MTTVNNSQTLKTTLSQAVQNGRVTEDDLAAALESNGLVKTGDKDADFQTYLDDQYGGDAQAALDDLENTLGTDIDGDGTVGSGSSTSSGSSTASSGSSTTATDGTKPATYGSGMDFLGVLLDSAIQNGVVSSDEVAQALEDDGMVSTGDPDEDFHRWLVDKYGGDANAARDYLENTLNADIDGDGTTGSGSTT